MKKHAKWFIPLCLLLTAGYFTMTQAGALRLAVILSGHPLSAFSYKLMDTPYSFDTAEDQTGYSLEDPPFEQATGSELVNWVVTRHRIFYTADYYGWG